MTPTRTLSPEELAALLGDCADGSYFDLDRRPLPAVLDTDCVRSGLGHQLRYRCPPRSVMTARDGSVRLFMEYDTLVETSERLPRFADQLGVPTTELKRVLNKDWLPHRLPARCEERGAQGIHEVLMSAESKRTDYMLRFLNKVLVAASDAAAARENGSVMVIPADESGSRPRADGER
jgi:hypothetical protein